MSQDDTDERERGILSPADRRFLRDPEEYSRQGQYERKSAIKQRVYDSILDLSLLFELLPPSQRHEIFGRSTGMGDMNFFGMFDDPQRLEHALRDGISFLYMSAENTGAGAGERLVREGVEHGEEKHGSHHAVVDIDIERQKQPVLAGRGREKMENGEALENGEIRALLESEQIPDEKVGQYLREDTETA